MIPALRGLAFVCCAAALCAQDGTSPSTGLETDWEIAPVVREIGAHASRLLPLLDRIDARKWVQKGASDTYVAQLQSSKDQAAAVASSAKTLAGNPSQLSASLELLFRIQSMDTMLKSLEEGMERYQSPAEAQVLARLQAENGANRERLQNYVVNLAAEREHEFQVMDREAQRCRGVLTQAPGRAGRKK
jgi:hypothetical protein